MIRVPLVVVLLVALWMVPASADPVTVDGSFFEFQWGVAPSAAFSCLLPPFCVDTVPLADQTTSPPWTFSGPALMLVTDVFIAGERFEVFDNNFSLGLTSNIVHTGSTP